MRDMGKLGVVAVLVIALGGCAAGAASEPAENDAAEVAATAEATVEPTIAPTETAEPVAAPIEMSAAPIDPATPWGEAGFESSDAWFLASMDAVWVGEMPTDDQLRGAGALACEQMASGTSTADVIAVTGEGSEDNNQKVATYAAITLCP